MFLPSTFYLGQQTVTGTTDIVPMELVTHLVSPYTQTETHFLTYIMEPQIKKSLNITKVRSEVVIQRMTNNTVSKQKGQTRQTLQRK